MTKEPVDVINKAVKKIDDVDKATTKRKTDDSKFVELNPTTADGADPLREVSALDERAPLSIQQRRARGRTMRRFKGRIAMARKRAAKRKASPEKLKMRARKKAREIIKNRLAAGKKYSEMSPSEKMQLDKRLLRISPTAIDRIATRQLPTVRKAEMERLTRVRGASAAPTTKESIDTQFDNFMNEMRECPPKVHHRAFTKEGRVKFDRRFKMYRSKEDKLDELFAQNFIEDATDLMNITESKLQKDKDDPCWDGHVQLGTKIKNGKEVPNCVPTESTDPYDREQGTDSLVRIYKGDTPGQNENYYQTDLGSDFTNLTRGDRVRFTQHTMDTVTGGEKQGTVVGSTVEHLRVRDSEGFLHLVRHRDVQLIEDLNSIFESRFDQNVVEYTLMEDGEVCGVFTQSQMATFEKVVDKLFAKFGINFDFTRHFRDRMSDARNNPCINVKELALMINKIYRKKVAGVDLLSKHVNTEVVIKDMQTDLNMPIAIEYDRSKDELRVVSKTIMRKKNFRTPNPEVKV